MGSKVAFYKGVRLWQDFKFWKPLPSPRGADERIGLSRKFARLVPRSRNFLYDITVHTAMKMATESITGLGPQAKHNLGLMAVQKALIDNSADDELGPLSWCEDNALKIVPSGSSGGGSYPRQQVLPFTALGAGFVPAIGDYVLIREPTGGAGFVSYVYAYASGTPSITVNLEEAIDATWEIYKLFAYFPSAQWVNVAGWENSSQADDKFSHDVIYSFKADAHPVWNASYVRNLA